MNDLAHVQVIRQRAIDHTIRHLSERDEKLLGIHFDASAHYLTMCERVIQACERYLIADRKQRKT